MPDRQPALSARFKYPLTLLLFPVLSACGLSEPLQAPPPLLPLAKEALGKQLFHDEQLSEPAGQSCASCHNAKTGFADRGLRVSPGADPTRYGNRNAPTIAYSHLAPDWHYNAEDGTWIGGFFLDGRASSLKEQAKGPLFNPLEMNNSSVTALRDKLRTRPYAQEIERLYGGAIWDQPERALDAIADALAAFEASSEVNPFSSKYDAYLRGETELSAIEKKGLQLFDAEDKGNCAACHPSQPGAGGQPPLFTDFSYDNLGTPVPVGFPFHAVTVFNPEGGLRRDQGLADNPRIQTDERGKFKVPTLRNSALTGPYMHNGIFADLEEVVAFYNKRDSSDRWGAPEVEANVNSEELGNLKLTAAEERALVAFLQTLSDGWSSTDPLVR
ncbi:MAG: cytochrome c peroxidase [Motiliproteus sp.]|jgi:cytochrome c peroxidase